ncbi:MAG: hypothetical protein AAB588_02035 [Patescibacteria group bacterium]
MSQNDEIPSSQKIIRPEATPSILNSPSPYRVERLRHAVFIASASLILGEGSLQLLESLHTPTAHVGAPSPDEPLKPLEPTTSRTPEACAVTLSNDNEASNTSFAELDGTDGHNEGEVDFTGSTVADDLHQRELPLPLQENDESPLFEEPFVNPLGIKERFEIVAALKSAYLIKILSILWNQNPPGVPLEIEQKLPRKRSYAPQNEAAHKIHRGSSFRTQPTKLGRGYSHHHNRRK